jgi:GntR family phosphonate transport system transcriptional regulator
LLDALRETPTITEALARVGVYDYRRQVTRVTARLPTPQEAELLRMPRKRPILVTENINIDQTGAVVEYGVACYPTPRVQIIFEP